MGKIPAEYDMGLLDDWVHFFPSNYPRDRYFFMIIVYAKLDILTAPFLQNIIQWSAAALVLATEWIRTR